MFIDQIVNNIRLKQNLTCVKNKKNMQSNDYIFKFYINKNI